MKKIILSVVGVFIIMITVNAQGFGFGIKGGTNFTKIMGQAFDQNFKQSYQLGGFAEIDFSKAIGIQPEVLFSEAYGRTVPNSNAIITGINGSQDIKLNYLSIPVLLRLNVCRLLTLNVGPQYSILINKHNTTLENGNNAFKSGDFAMVGGAQLNLGALRIYGRYDIGLSNINDLSNQDKWTNQQLQLGVGLKL